MPHTSGQSNYVYIELHALITPKHDRVIDISHSNRQFPVHGDTWPGMMCVLVTPAEVFFSFMSFLKSIYVYKMSQGKFIITHLQMSCAYLCDRQLVFLKWHLMI